jgi:hypothetical protein
MQKQSAVSIERERIGLRGQNSLALAPALLTFVGRLIRRVARHRF